ncbi:hypothetical protein [Candidatus Lariskella endosymbiont of Epinotia ramella]|uniref:hypothetical protein n=1 Tax=Candidatus Lariskella endosymbiont of Epinotia ramella TaxID=3066224 RepID=UPI0030CF890C
MLDPIKNNDLYGHDKISEFFLDSVLSDRLPHALLFLGQSSIGKATFAYQLVKFLFLYDTYGKEILERDNTLSFRQASMFGTCENQGDEANFSIQGTLKSFSQDPILKRIEHYSHTDFMVLRDEFTSSLESKKNRGILIDEVRVAIQFLQSTPAFGNYRVVIIDSADYMNSYAANALLKTLEEPGKNTMLILIASGMRNIPATLLSRCRVIKFSQISYSDFCRICGEKSKNLPIEIYNLIGGNVQLLQSILDMEFSGLEKISKIHNFQDINDIIEWAKTDSSVVLVLKIAILRLVVRKVKIEVAGRNFGKKEAEESVMLFDKLYKLLYDTDGLYMNQENVLASALFLLNKAKW